MCTILTIQIENCLLSNIKIPISLERKKIFYQLTDNGKEIAQVHDELHKNVKQRFQEELTSQYSESELELIDSLLSDLLKREAKI